MGEISPTERRQYEALVAGYRQMEKRNKRQVVYCVLQGLAGLVFFAGVAAFGGWVLAGIGAFASMYLVHLGYSGRILGDAMVRARTEIELLLAGDPGPLQESIHRDSVKK